ncbi:4'-phosphopantetheinyl transferase family protein [Nocardioides sp. P5_C9_2]
MSGVGTAAVDVRWHRDRTADEALVDHARAATGVGPSRVIEVGRLCPQCGSAAHGRPWVRVPDGRDTRRLEVSVARSGPHVVTALADRPVGVDVEHVGDVARGWDPALVLALGERADSPLEQARSWTRKEAVLKSRGTGLVVPMSLVVLAEVDWADLPAPPGYVAAVSPAGLAGRAAPSGAATGRTARPGPRR